MKVTHMRDMDILGYNKYPLIANDDPLIGNDDPLIANQIANRDVEKNPMVPCASNP